MSKLLVGFLAGAAVGALAGILLAPDSGSNTRKKIADKTGDLSDTVKKSFNKFIDGVKDTYAGAKEEIDEFGQKVKGKLGEAKHELKNEVKNAF
jgi:gas vesicle protein